MDHRYSVHIADALHNRIDRSRIRGRHNRSRVPESCQRNAGNAILFHNIGHIFRSAIPHLDCSLRTYCQESSDGLASDLFEFRTIPDAAQKASGVHVGGCHAQLLHLFAPFPNIFALDSSGAARKAQ